LGFFRYNFNFIGPAEGLLDFYEYTFPAIKQGKKYRTPQPNDRLAKHFMKELLLLQLQWKSLLLVSHFKSLDSKSLGFN